MILLSVLVAGFLIYIHVDLLNFETNGDPWSYGDEFAEFHEWLLSHTPHCLFAVRLNP